MTLGASGRISPETHVASSRPPSVPAPPGALRGALLVAKKDLLIEIRTREIVTTAGFFAALVAILTSVAFYSGPDTTKRVAPGAIWLAEAFASVLALGRTWQRERDDGALLALLVSPLQRGAIFLGKALGIFVFVAAIVALVVPIVALLFHVDLLEVGPKLALVLLLGTIGVAGTGTLFGVMTVRTRARDLVFATVLFPLLSPALICGVAATREIFAGAPMEDLTDYFLLLGVFDLVSVGLGLMLFGALVED
jgi:heme exporter protein B